MSFSKFLADPKATEQVTAEAQPAIADIAEQALADARAHVPIETGELYDSLHIEEIENGKRVVAGTDHWVFPEFGTSEMAAQPYLRTIIDDIGLSR